MKLRRELCHLRSIEARSVGMSNRKGRRKRRARSNQAPESNPAVILWKDNVVLATPPPSSAARRRETTDVPIFAAGSRNVGQSGGAERSITLREGSPACSVSTAGVPQRPIAPVALAAEGYVDVEGVYVIPPYKHGRKQYMTASTELQLATEASARSCGVPSVQE